MNIFDIVVIYYQKTPTQRAELMDELNNLSNDDYGYVKQVVDLLDLIRANYENVLGIISNPQSSIRIAKISSNFTVERYTKIIVADTTSGNITVTIDPSVKMESDEVTVVKKFGANTVTIDVVNSATSATGTINGVSSYQMTAAGDNVTVCYIGDDEFIINK